MLFEFKKVECSLEAFVMKKGVMGGVKSLINTYLLYMEVTFRSNGVAMLTDSSALQSLTRKELI